MLTPGVIWQYNPQAMGREREASYFQRAAEAVESFSPSSPVDRAKLLIDLASIESSRLLAESQRLLAEVTREANTLKRIELGLGEELPLQISDVYAGAPVADLSGQRPEEFQPLPTPILPAERVPRL